MEEKTQAELAYKELSHRILTQEISANERIVEQVWAKELQVNRAAIRESLTRLLGEGMVYPGPHRGYFVKEMSRREIHEMREVREMLETTAFQLACERATADQIKEIEETCDDFSNFVNKGYFTGAHEADLRFHQLLVASSGNRRLMDLYQRSHIPLFQRRAAQARIHLEDFQKTDIEHRQILAMLKKKEINVGKECLKNHFNRGEKDAIA